MLWHVYGHSLAAANAQTSVALGRRLLADTFAWLRGRITASGYAPDEVAGEVLADAYAIMISQRRIGRDKA